MAQGKNILKEVDELRSELAALRAERAAQKRKSKKKRSKVPKDGGTSKPEAQPGEDDGGLEQAIKELAEVSEKEIAEHPAIAVGIAFLLGFLAGRITRM